MLYLNNSLLKLKKKLNIHKISSKTQKLMKTLPEIFDPLPLRLQKIKQLSSILFSAKNPLLFTGAGISTSSGVPDYRSSYQTLLKTGPGSWETPSNKLKYSKIPVILPAIEAVPTKTHMGISSLLRAGLFKHVITQNVDNLHERSGVLDKDLITLHGNICEEVCEVCKEVIYRDYYVDPERQFPFRNRTCPLLNEKGLICKGDLKKSLVQFGEKVPEKKLNKAFELVKGSDFCLAIGSSLRVNPAAKIPKAFLPKRLGIINLQRTHYDSQAEIVINGFCDEIFEGLMKELGVKIQPFLIEKGIYLVRGSQELKVQGRDLRDFERRFFSVEEIEVYEGRMGNFIGRSREEDGLEVDIGGIIGEITVRIKFYGNLDEPNLVINVEKGEKLRIKLVLDEFLKEWGVEKV